MAAIYYETGEQTKASNYLEMALEIHRSQNNLEGLAQSLNNAAVLIYNQRPIQAKDCLNQALAISEKIQDRDGQATHLHNLGAVSSEMKELEHAIGYYTTALSIRRDIRDYVGIKDSLYNLALIWSELGDNKRSVQMLEEAVILDQKFNYSTLDRDIAALANCKSHPAETL